MLNVSHGFLKLLSSLVWYIGAIALLLKGGFLLFEAEGLAPNRGWPWAAMGTGVILGLVKARYLFVKSCKKNINRINGLASPKIWQFFRPTFFLLLFLMISAGAALSSMAHNNYAFLIGVGALDFSISVALMGGGVACLEKGGGK